MLIFSKKCNGKLYTKISFLKGICHFLKVGIHFIYVVFMCDFPGVYEAKWKTVYSRAH